jgi:hypothetical protein
MRFDEGFAFGDPIETWMNTHANGNLHDFLSIHATLTVFIGNRVDDLRVERHTDERLFRDCATQSDAN